MMHLSRAAAILGFGNWEQKEHGIELHQRFKAHMIAEGLSFGTKEEYMYRFEIFKTKDAEINHWNNKQNSFRLAHNMFSTMTQDEAKKMLGTRVNEVEFEQVELDTSNLSTSVDWRTKGAVNAVKNQARCGSCWAFGATAVTEAAHFQASGTLLSLSEQEVVSCDKTCYGCNGGW